jgi:threonine/homoserine/homoserine lactone efflux protein
VQQFLTGALAGYAIAIPVGAIAVLIVELGMRRGFRFGAAAGAGAATADFAFAGLAATGGTALAAVLAPWSHLLRVVAVGALLGIGLRGLIGLLAVPAGPSREALRPASPVGTYARFVGLTLLNPQTVIYFAALILALPDLGTGLMERAAFVVGAGLASLSWQLVLAAIGALAHHRLPPRAQLALSLGGNLLVIGFAIGILAGGA